MKIEKMLAVSNSMPVTALVLLLGWLSLALPAASQSAGNNTVYGGSPLSTVASSGFVDASVLPDTLTTHDICARINYALWVLTQSPYGNGTSSGAGVIDARGINTSNSSTSSGALICNFSPWSSSSGKTLAFFPNAVILLPAGTIGLKSGANWVLPDRTRIIGVGSGVGTTFVTTFQAGNGLTGAMIQMGGASGTPVPCPATNNICNSVGVEDLRVDGENIGGVIGIQNQYSQELSYVNRVAFYRVKGTSLQIGGASGNPAGAQNSGPYSTIRFEYPSTSTPASSTVCAQITGAPTRGIHGLTCSNLSTTIPNVAVNVDSASNSIEDVYITGFADGIQVGANGAAQSNILLNISGAFSSGNLIHVCTGTSNGSCGTTNTVTDLSIIGVANSSTGGNTIKDDVTTTMVSDAHVGIYVLGEQVSNAGYSRFTTSPNWPNWSVGSTSLTVGTACTPGSLYSNTAGVGGSTLYVCLGGSGMGKGW